MKKAHGVHTNGLKVHRTLQLEPGRVGWGGGDAVGCQARAYLIKGEKGVWVLSRDDFEIFRWWLPGGDIDPHRVKGSPTGSLP